MGRIRTTVVAGLSLLLGLAGGGVAAEQAVAAGPNCKITVAVDKHVPQEVQPEIAVTLNGCGKGTLKVQVNRGSQQLTPQTMNVTGNGTFEFWGGADQRGQYSVVASMGSVRSSTATFKIVSVPTAHSAGWKVVGDTSNAWGKFEVDGPIKVWTEVWLGNRWSKSQERRTDKNGNYAIPLTYGASTPGIYEYRVAGQYASGEVLRTDSIWLERVARPTAGTAGVKELGAATNVWGTFDVYTPTQVWTEVWLGNRWSKSQERTTDRNGNYVIPLTYGARASGVTRWRVAGIVDGTVIRTNEFSLRRVGAPTVASAGSKPVGELSNVWGRYVTPDGPIKVWTEVWQGNRWSKSQERTTGAGGNYAIPLTYGANAPSTHTWRVAGQYPEGILYTGEFSFRRY